MLGPLPRMYRIAVAVVALLLGIAGGAWAAFMLPYPILITAGASVGLGVGALVTYALVHQSDPAQPQHVRRRRLH